MTAFLPHYASPQTLWIDSGGTTTTLTAFRAARKPVYTVRPTLPMTQLKPYVKRFLMKHHIEPRWIVFGLRGVWTPSEKRIASKYVHGLGVRCTVCSDVELNHWKAFGPDPGILVNAGTGSIALGRNRTGVLARSGGFGPYLGDEGSAYWIGKYYLKNVLNFNKEYLYINKYNLTIKSYKSLATLGSLLVRKRTVNAVRPAQLELVGLTMDNLKKLQWKRGLVPLALAGGLFQNQWFRNGYVRLLKKKGRQAVTWRPFLLHPEP